METSIGATLSLSTLDKPSCTCSAEECSVGRKSFVYNAIFIQQVRFSRFITDIFSLDERGAE